MSDISRTSRRDMLAKSVAGMGATAFAAAYANAAGKDESAGGKVRYGEMLPHEFRAKLEEKPLAYLPLGTLEWHGEHLPLGSDAIQSEALMLECARRYGGIVLPPIHVGPSRSKLTEDGRQLVGMDYVHKKSVDPPRQLDGSAYWISDGLFSSLLDAILVQLKRAGFKAVFADGHGPSRVLWGRDIKDRENRFGLKLFGAEALLTRGWKSMVDHAGDNETSLVMHYRPELVDLSQLSPARDDWPVGVGGRDPRDATAEQGKKYMESSLGLMIDAFKKAGV